MNDPTIATTAIVALFWIIFFLILAMALCIGYVVYLLAVLATGDKK